MIKSIYSKILILFTIKIHGCSKKIFLGGRNLSDGSNFNISDNLGGRNLSEGSNFKISDNISHKIN